MPTQDRQGYFVHSPQYFPQPIQDVWQLIEGVVDPRIGEPGYYETREAALEELDGRLRNWFGTLKFQIPHWDKNEDGKPQWERDYTLARLNAEMETVLRLFAMLGVRNVEHHYEANFFRVR